MPDVAVIDARDVLVTPVFRWIDLENIPKSEEAGYMVKEQMEVVQVRFAGSNNYSPVFPVNAFWRREGNTVITYAERWADQYRQFKQGNPQEAHGTPLEMLRPYGVTPEELSLCRAMKIYSIEALDALDGPNLKNIGMGANKLKAMATKYLAEKNNGAGAADRIAALEAQIAALMAASTRVPAEEPTPEDMDQAAAEVEEVMFGAMTDDELRDYINEKSGSRPDGRYKTESLVNMAKSL